MSLEVILRWEAEADLAAAMAWYEGQRQGLSGEFLLCVEEAVNRVARNPRSYAEVEPGIRRALVSRFPYAIFYVTSESVVTVLAVFHCFRDPKQWKRRV